MNNRDLLLSGNPKMTTLMLLLIDMYGTEALTWDPETVKMELEEDLRVELSDDIQAKLAVGSMILTTDRFYTSTPDFIHFCNVMNDEAGLPNVWSPADAYEIAWSFVELGLLDPPEEPWERLLSPEILAYIVCVLRQAGISIPPDSLKFIPSDLLLGPDIGELAHDPVLYNAAYDESTNASDALNQYINEQTYDLLQELDGLQLRHGSVKEITQKLLDSLPPPVRLIAQ